jgi:hypothetical protein
VREDPGEKVNIFKQKRTIAKHLQSQVRTILEENEGMSRTMRIGKKKKAEMDKDVVRQLKALGYFDD